MSGKSREAIAEGMNGIEKQIQIEDEFIERIVSWMALRMSQSEKPFVVWKNILTALADKSLKRYDPDLEFDDPQHQC